MCQVLRKTDVRNVPPLEALLEYRNEDVIDSFCASYDIDRTEAEDIFKQMLIFMWLAKSSENKLLKVIDEPILVIDEMWHTFILFTREYHRFSREMFGAYFHHAPTTKRDRERNEERFKKYGNELLISEKRERYSEIFDRLGKETFIKWFHEYPERYSPERLLTLRKK